MACIPSAIVAVTRMNNAGMEPQFGWVSSRNLQVGVLFLHGCITPQRSIQLLLAVAIKVTLVGHAYWRGVDLVVS